MESRDGNVYCGDCKDFIYDTDLEARRLQKGSLTLADSLVYVLIVV